MKIFIAKDNYFGICASLLKENEYKLPNERFNFKRTLEWCKNHVNKTHVEISKFTYSVKRKKNIPFNKKLERQNRKLEQEKNSIEISFKYSTMEYEIMMKKSKELEELNKKIDDKMTRWMELEEKME